MRVSNLSLELKRKKTEGHLPGSGVRGVIWVATEGTGCLCRWHPGQHEDGVVTEVGTSDAGTKSWWL